ncbi:YadA-like family protein [Acinetobacter bereziniae]|nr:YadA-like family protein [Acinetobacter bereziniae]MBO3653524.1 YadA-like family protein [Acinetobacter bereziniae]
MNKTYKVVWNESLGTWCAISETSKVRGKRSSGKAIVASAVIVASTMSGVTFAADNYVSVNDGGVQSGNYNNDGAGVDGSVAIGPDSSSSGASGVAIGNNADVHGYQGVAIGNNAQAGYQSMALGHDAIATAFNSMALGGNSIAYTDGTALGQGTYANKLATAMGNGSLAVGLESTAYGYSALAGTDSFSQPSAGTDPDTIGKAYATAMGSRAKASAQGSTAIGAGSVAEVESGVALGSSSVANTAAGVAGYIPTGANQAQLSAINATQSTLGAVSVGSAGNTRQITNVAAGTVDTDAVNVAQLKAVQAASETHYVSINDGGVQSGNYNNDGAKGLNSLAIGVDSNAIGSNSVAVGTSNTVEINNGVALGLGNKLLTHDGSTAIGINNISSGWGSAVIGNNNQSKGDANQALGNDNQVEGRYNTSVGYANSVKSGEGSQAVGATNNVQGWSSGAFGRTNEVSGNEAFALGSSNKLTSSYSIIVGRGNNIGGGEGSSVVGNNNNVQGWSSGTLGQSNTVRGNESYAGGNANNVQADYSMVLGRYNKINNGFSYVVGDRNIVNGSGVGILGNSNTVAQNDTYVLGSGITTTQANSVVLGNASTDRAATTVDKVTINGEDYTVAGAGSVANGIVSVGKAGAERQIINVAAGEVSATSTDAVNGSQLFATNKAIADSQTHYVSINDGGVQSGNYNNDGAQGKNSLVVGMNSTTTVNATNNVSVGLGNYSQADNAIAVGSNNYIDINNAVALGINNNVQLFGGTTAVGIGNSSYGRENAIVGNNNKTLGSYHQVFGSNNVINGTTPYQSILGYGNIVEGAEFNIAVGTSNKVTGYYTPQGGGGSVIAIGHGNNVAGIESSSFGNNNKINNNYSTAIGLNNTVDGGAVFVVGNNNTVAQNDTYVLGSGITTTQDNSVVLGNASTDRAATTVDKVTINGEDYTVAGAGSVANGIVSVGKAGAERQIINVAAGEVSATSTDAINGSQLFATNKAIADSQTHYVSINDGGTQSGNYNNDGAKGTNSLAIGVGAEAVGDNAIAIGTGAKAEKATTLAMGLNAVATHDGPSAYTYNAVAVGTNVSTNGVRAVALGLNSSAVGESALAVGSGNSAQASGTIAIGVNNTAGELNNVAIGSRNTTSNGWSSIAVGAENISSGGNLVNMGFRNHVDGMTSAVFGSDNVGVGVTTGLIVGLANRLENAGYSVAVGHDNFISGSNSVVAGLKNRSTVGYSVLFGRENSSATNHGIGVGIGNKVNDEYSSAVGALNQLNASQSVALGNRNIVSNRNTHVLGNDVTTTQDNSVLLGNASTDRAATTIDKVTINGEDYTVAGAGSVANGIVSVGKAGAERQIINVAAGEVSATSTDAVNGSQLFATNKAIADSQTHYVSVNDDGIQGGNYNNDGAQGKNSLALGVGAKATGENAIAIGNVTTDAANSIAIGNNNVLSNTAGASTVIGSNNNVTGNEAVALGSNNTVKDFSGVAVGSYNRALGYRSITVGAENQTDGQWSSAIGLWNTAGGERATALGANNKILGRRALGVGVVNEISSTSEYSSAIGAFNKITDSNKSLAAGFSNTITGGDNNNVLGNENQLNNAKNSTAIGNKNIVAQDNTQVLGNNVTTTQANSVILGNASTDRAATAESKVSINGQDYAFAGVGSASNGVVSVGKAGAERQIINVAAGKVSSDSTDAVNGSQLYATNQAITEVGKSAAAAKTEVIEGDNIVVTETQGKNGQSVYNVATAKEVSFNKTTVGTVITDSATGKITGLTAGEVSATSTDAINGSQLYATNQAIADSKTHYVSVNDDGVQADNYNNDGATGKNALAVGVGSKAAGENAVAIGYNNNVVQDKTVALGSSITTTQANSVVLGNESTDRAATSESKVTILGQDYAFAGVGSASNGVVSVGKVGAERQIINVAAGKVSSDSTDAVNGSQLYATNQAITEVGKSAAAAKTEVVEGDNIVVTETQGKNGQSIYNVATAKEVSFDKTTVGTVITDSTTGKITGLTAGEVSATSTDAINGSQLYATNQAIADSKTHYVSVNDDGIQADNYNNDGATGKNALAVGVGSKAAGENAVAIGYNNNVVQDKTVALGSSITTTQANSVVLGNESTDRAATSESKVTILGQDYAFAGLGSASNGVVSVGKVGGERQIINVAAGQLSATSTDAVNGSQLYATNQAISSLQGQVGGAKSTVTEGKNTTITKTTNADGSTDYQVATKDDVSFDSVTVGNIKADAQTNKITGLADGEVSATSNEAVNGSQLHGTAESVANVLGGNAKVNADGTVSTSNIGNTGKDNVHDAIASLQGQVAGSKTSVSAGKNTVVNSSTNADGSNNYQVALADDINLNSVTANQVTANQVKADQVIANQVMANQVNVGKVTIDGTSNKVSGLANGTISKDSTDAINGSQLHQTNSNVAQYLGGGSTLNQDGSIKAPTYNVAGGSYNNVGDALGAVDTRVSNLEQAFYNTNKNVDDLRNDTYAGIAGAMAVGNLPQPTEAGMSMMSAGLSGYRGETAVAVGISAISDSNKIIWKMGASADSRSNIGGAVSVGYQWK